MITIFLEAFGVIVVYMTIWYIIALIQKNNSVADIAWGGGFAVVALFTFIFSAMQLKNLIITMMVLLWGLRLSTYIAIRNTGKSEDFRYKSMREKWGPSTIWKSYIYVFLLQGCLMFLIALPVIWVNYVNLSIELSLIDKVGISIWLIGFSIETIADLQMYIFKNKNNSKKKILNTGLWKYSRHPNYFGEILVWWGIFLLSMTVQNGLWTIISPLTITYLLTRVSGVPMLEKKYDKNPEYKKYIQKTNALIPWFPKQS